MLAHEVAFWVSLASFFLSGFASLGAQVLRNFSHRELKAYCRLHRRAALYEEVVVGHQNAALAAECFTLVCIAIFFIQGGYWFAEASSQLGPFTKFGIQTVAVLMLIVAVVAVPIGAVRFWSAPLLYHTWRIWRVIVWCGKPLMWGIGAIQAFMRRAAGKSEASSEDQEEAFGDEIRTIVNAGQSYGLLEEDAREMIEGVMELGDVDVADVMTPRSHMDAVDAEQSWTEVLKFAADSKRTRIPVYRETKDTIVGVLYVKDVLPELLHDGNEPRVPLSSLLRDPMFVPDTKKVDDLLQEFLDSRQHMAIVVDEYQAVSGVVTIEDCLEEIVGEILDEHEPDAEGEIVKSENGVATVLGRLHIDEVNETLGLALPDPIGADSIGGLVIEQLGHIPKPGESVEVDGFRLIVMLATRNRIEKIRIEPLDIVGQRETA